MKAKTFGLVSLVVLGACAVQADPPATCNVKSVNCAAAGAGVGGSGAGMSSSSAGMTAAAGSSGAATGGMTATAGADSGGAPATAGAPGTAGAATGGSSGTAAGGAPAAGAPAGGAPAGGAPAGGAPAGGAPAGGAPAGGSGGAPATGLIVIRANRGSRNYLKVVAPPNYVQWTATTVADAEKFEQVAAGAGQFKLRATSVDKFVALDQAVVAPATAQNDYLVANATEANAVVLKFDLCASTNAKTAACAPNCRGIQVVSDDDVDNFVASDDQFTLANGSRARSNTCGATATAWESWEIIAQ